MILTLAHKIIGGAGLAVILALGVMLLIEKGESRHWQKKYDGEKSAHELTVANYRRASAEAKAADLENARAVETRYATIAKEQNDDLRAQLDRARASAADYAARLRNSTQANSSGGGATNLPGSANTTSNPSGPGEETILADAMICSENTIKLQGWQDWYKRVSR